MFQVFSIPFTWLDQGLFWQSLPKADQAQIDLDSSPLCSHACVDVSQKVLQVQVQESGVWYGAVG